MKKDTKDAIMYVVTYLAINTAIAVGAFVLGYRAGIRHATPKEEQTQFVRAISFPYDTSFVSNGHVIFKIEAVKPKTQDND